MRSQIDLLSICIVSLTKACSKRGKCLEMKSMQREVGFLGWYEWTSPLRRKGGMIDGAKL